MQAIAVAALSGMMLGIALGVAFSVAFGTVFSTASDAASARKKAVFDKPPRYPLGL